MRKEKSSDDVRIVTYDTCKGKVANISFYDGLGDIIGERVRLINYIDSPDYLYFENCKGADIENSVKMANGKLQFSKGSAVVICAEFVGTYQLKFDGDRDMYYIDKSEKSQPIYRGGNNKVPHPNYTNGKRVPIPKVKKVEVVNPYKSAVTRTEIANDNEAILEMLDVLDTYDTNKAVYKAGHTLISTIKEMLK